MMKEERLFQARVKTPTILQMEATECGSTALAIILAYYHKFLTAEEARTACSVSRDGTKAINIVKAARNYGMQARGANLEIDELQEVNVPFMVFWEFNHFLVVEGYTPTKVFINDPATGPRSISWDEFEQGYTGVVLNITPGEAFKPSGKPERSTMTLLLQRLGNNYLAILFIILSTIALIIPKIATPIFTKAFIDQLLIDKQTNLIPVILLGIAFTTIADTLLTWFQMKFLNRLKTKLEVINAVNFLWHLFHIPIRYFQQRSSGDIVQRNEISEKIASVLAKDLPENIVGLLEMLAFASVIFFLCWQLGLVLLVLVIIDVSSLQISKKRLTDMGRRYAQDKGKLEGIETNGIQIMETLKVSALEHYFFNRWAAFYTKLLNTQQQLIWATALLNLIPNFLGFLVNIVIICYGSYLVISGEITVGTIVAIQALMTSFLNPLHKLIEFINTLNQLKGDIVRLNDVMNTPTAPGFSVKDKGKSELLLQDTPLILQIKELSFSYSALDPPIIDQLSMSIFRGERVAVVGPSGSGKSSLAKLICGLDSSGAGAIYINGIACNQISRSSLSKYIAYVDQNILFYPGNLRENLTLWDNTIDDNTIYEALRTVNLIEDIIGRGGLGTIITETGSNFSGGQCQRLEIARALLRKPKFLILDEATSAMDTTLEASIYTNLMAMNTTLLIIAHRLSAIQHCDRIYVLDQGQVIQEGSHLDLINQPGLYQDLAAMET